MSTSNATKVGVAAVAAVAALAAYWYLFSEDKKKEENNISIPKSETASSVFEISEKEMNPENYANFESIFKSKNSVLLCGAGVAMSISNGMTTWNGLVNEYARVTMTILGLNDAWLAQYNQINQLMDKITYIENFLNVNWNNQLEALEKHRMVAQFIFRRPTLDRPERAQILCNLKKLILTTNYDTVIEDCNPTELISVSHIEALKYFPEHFFAGNETLGPGPFFQSPLEHFVVHIHGRYFDIGPEHGFCFTQNEYENQEMLTRFLDFMVPVVRSKSLIFIGAMGTVRDIHFVQLWGKVRNTSKEHYILYHEGETADIFALVDGIFTIFAVKITPICYGSGRDNLWTFLSEFT
jgi:hypothetical protein